MKASAPASRSALQAIRGLRPELVLAVLLIVYLFWQVVVPLVALLYSSFKAVRPSDPTFLDLSFTLSNFRQVLLDQRLWGITLTTGVFAGASSLLALVVGTFLAWVTSRTNAPFRILVSSLVLYQLALPELLSPIAWRFLLGPRIGLINQAWSGVTGSEEALLSVESLPGMIWVQAFLLVPVVYLFAVPALTGIDRALEEAALISGADRRATVRDITLRLAAPALAATFILVAVRSWESFEVPWFLGVPVGILTYSSQIFFSTITPPSNTGLIAGYAVPMLAVAVLMVLWYGRFNRLSSRYVTISGRGFRSEAATLQGWSRWAAGGLALVVVMLGIGLPILMLVWMSLLPFYRPPSLDALQYLNLDAYRRALTSDRAVGAFQNSLIVGVGCSVVIVTVSSLSAWVVLRSRQAGRRVIDTLTFLPMSIPNIIVGICFLWIYLLMPFTLLGTYWGLMLAYVTLFLAIGARNIYSRMLQLHPELEEAALISGASTMATLRTITLPGLAPAVLASVVYVVVWSFKELPNALLLSSSTTRTAAAFLFDMSTAATIGEQAAVGLVILAFLIGLVTVFQALARKYGLRGF